MSEPLIPGGYILLSRKLIESEIWDKPPLYLKIWIYILSRAQHTQYKSLKKGQVRTSIPEIMEACSWHIGYRKQTPSKSQVYKALEWMRTTTGNLSRNSYERNHESNEVETMITTTKATQGMVITIDKYCVYQDPKNYESNNESNNENHTKEIRKQRQGDNINKNVKNDKNNNNKRYSSQQSCDGDSDEKSSKSSKKTEIKFQENTFEILAVNYLIAQILKLNPNAKVPKSLGDKQKWAVEIDRMKRLDKRSEDEIKRVLKFATEHPFWQKNILSTSKFRKQFDRLVIERESQKQKHNVNKKDKFGEFLDDMKEW